jgi:hypothetical protein
VQIANSEKDENKHPNAEGKVSGASAYPKLSLVIKGSNGQTDNQTAKRPKR